MQEYDFKALNDKEFEALCVDLIGSQLGKRFERFKPGRDSGVDGRFFTAPTEEMIIQCKHWANTPIEQLIRHLRTKELSKVEKLNPTRYFLAVSNPLSRADKKLLQTALAPHITNDSDIFGREDLNDLLSKNSEIELRHYKLWISSTTVLKHLLNKAIADRSSFALEEALANSQIYVLTSNHQNAIRKLEELGTVITTGEPGIGKTTLAEQLCLSYATQDFEVIKISDEIREAESLFEIEKKQAFYFDDFLGRNYLEALSGHEGSHIVNFMRRISKDKSSKRFILTSRSTILNQGKILIDLFKSQNIDKNEYELSASQLTEIDKAKILYNHMWHSGISAEHMDEIYLDKRYRTIISHRNFNPRLIRFILDPERITHVPASEYWTYITKTLRDPIDVWENPFNAQQDDFSRALTLIVSLNGRAVSEADLSEAYSRYISLPENSSLSGRRDFVTNTRHLTGSLLNRIIKPKTSDVFFDLFNPSLGDYLLKRYSHDTPTLRSAFICLRSNSSLSTLENLASNKIISASTHQSIRLEILRHASRLDFAGYHPEYIANAVVNIADHAVTHNVSAVLDRAIAFVCSEPTPTYFEFTALAFKLALPKKIITTERAIEFVIEACDKSPTIDELGSLLSIYKELPNDTPVDVLRCHLEEAIIAYFEEHAHDEFEDSRVFGHQGYIDIQSAEENLSTIIVEKFAELGIDWDIDHSSITDAYDVFSRRDNYFSPDEQNYSRNYPRQHSYIDEIDDLFARN